MSISPSVTPTPTPTPSPAPVPWGPGAVLKGILVVALAFGLLLVIQVGLLLTTDVRGWPENWQLGLGLGFTALLDFAMLGSVWWFGLRPNRLDWIAIGLRDPTAIVLTFVGFALVDVSLLLSLGTAAIFLIFLFDLVLFAAVVPASVVMARSRDGQTEQRLFGLPVARLWPYVLARFAPFLMILLGALYQWLVQSLGLGDLFRSSVPDELIPRSLNTLIGLLLFGAVLAPIVEEVFFRGFVLAGLARRWGAQWALMGSSVLFGLVHLSQGSGLGVVPLTWLLALFLGWLYQRSGSLWPSILAHALNNGYSLVIVYLAAEAGLR